jgi:hypothetical protein
MAVRQNNSDGENELTGIPPVPKPPLPVGAYDSVTDAYDPTKDTDSLYVYASQGPGKLPVRFTRQSWDQMGGDKGGYKEVPAAPPEVRKLNLSKQDSDQPITT